MLCIQTLLYHQNQNQNHQNLVCAARSVRVKQTIRLRKNNHFKHIIYLIYQLLQLSMQSVCMSCFVDKYRVLAQDLIGKAAAAGEQGIYPPATS